MTETMAPGSPLHVRGTVLPGGQDRDVYVVDGRITFEPVPAAVTVAAGGWIVPGLVDAHAHLSIASPVPHAPAEERVRASAQAQLAAGVLLVREPGSPDRASAGLGDGEGLPRVITGGRFLAPPGGYVPGLAREVAAADLPAAVRQEVEASGAWAKVIGDFFAPTGEVVSHWDQETLRGAAEAAHAQGARIAIHATRPDVIEKAIRAGFDSIEHGTGLTPELAEAMAEHRATLVPTMIIGEGYVAWAANACTPEGFREVRRWVEGLPAAVKAVADAGVLVLAGTDAGMGPHGQIAREVGLLLGAGLEPEQALGAASWDARAYLGLPGVEEGAPADLVVFGDDPRSGPEALAAPRLVILGGRVAGRGSAPCRRVSGGP